MAKIYVIASNEDKQETRNVIEMLLKQGYKVHDWTDMQGKRLTREKIENDFEELINSDCAIVINASRVTPGKYIEIGACKAIQKPIVFIGNPAGMLSKFGIIVASRNEAFEQLSIALLKIKLARH